MVEICTQRERVFSQLLHWFPVVTYVCSPLSWASQISPSLPTNLITLIPLLSWSLSLATVSEDSFCLLSSAYLSPCSLEQQSQQSLLSLPGFLLELSLPVTLLPFSVPWALPAVSVFSYSVQRGTAQPLLPFPGALWRCFTMVLARKTMLCKWFQQTNK